MSNYKVVGTSGAGVYLLVNKRKRAPTTARVLDDGQLFPELTIQAILGRGYWEEASLPDAELDALLADAFDVPEGRAVPIPPRRSAAE